MKMLTYKKLMSAVVLAGMVMASPVSHASALINSLFVPGINQIEDTNADRLLRADANGTIVLGGVNYRQLTSADTLSNGDIIQSILNMTNANGSPIAANGGVFNAPYGLLAYSELVLGGKTTAGGIDSFTVSANITSTLLDGVNGALVNLYEHTAGTLTTLFSSAPATGISTVTAGSGAPITTFGLKTGDFWQIRTPTGTLASLFGATPGSGQAGLYEFGLSVLTNAGALPIGPKGIVSGALGHVGEKFDIVGDGSGFAVSSGTCGYTSPAGVAVCPGIQGWDLSTNTTVAFNNVPEPELLVLLSVGLLAGGLTSRRRNA